MDADSPIVEDVRRRAMELSGQFDHDLHKYAQHLREVERRYHSRLVDQITVIRSEDLDRGDAKPDKGSDSGQPS